MTSPNDLERYPIKYSRFSSHTRISKIIAATIPRKDLTRVLDVGCSKGGLFRLLPVGSILYLGVEPHLEDFKEAQRLGVPVLNLDALKAIKETRDQFDFVIYADVLEHIANPEKILIETHRVMAPGSKVIVSVPNIAHFSIRLLLLFGKWNYTQRGILDNTHLRFFTRKSLGQFARKNDYKVVRWFYTPIPIEALPIRLPSLIFDFVDYLNYSVTRLIPQLFAFQFVVVLEPALKQENTE
jgi:2-polyprenyl-3-methyl-5-hydroxy-6-metoxy-1,4-benzoquinol methylase